MVSWWVGPPPGRSLAALDEVADDPGRQPLPRSVSLAVEYERETDSHGRLIISFARPPRRARPPPPWTGPSPLDHHALVDDDPTAPVELTDQSGPKTTDIQVIRRRGRLMTPRLLTWLWSALARVAILRHRNGWTGDRPRHRTPGRRPTPHVLPWPALSNTS